MDIKNLVPVDYSNQRVLLTAQVAEVYGTSPARIRDNFKRAKKRFQEGVHYFKLEGESLKELREQSMCVLKAYAQPIIPKGCRSLTLWTHEGCARHCKMLNTPQAWEMFDALEKHYFNSALTAPAVPPVEDSLFPDEPVKSKKKRRPLPEFAVVYSALLDNALVKIGLTCDFNRRIKEVRKETGQDVKEVFTTGNLPLDDARKLEATVKAKFHEKNKGGELYDVPFEQVKAAIDKHDDKFDKLIALANILPDSEEKTRLVLQAASLI